MALANRIENGIIAAVTLILTVFVFGVYNHIFVMKPILNELKETREIVERVAMKDTYSISNDFEKMRTKKGGNIVLDLNNELNHIEVINPDTLVIDSVEGRTFWNKLFEKK